MKSCISGKEPWLGGRSLVLWESCVMPMWCVRWSRLGLLLGQGTRKGPSHHPVSVSPLLLGTCNVLESFSQAGGSWHPMQELILSGFSAYWSPVCDGSGPGWDLLTPQEFLRAVSTPQGKARSQSPSQVLFFSCTLRQKSRWHLCRH